MKVQKSIKSKIVSRIVIGLALAVSILFIILNSIPVVKEILFYGIYYLFMVLLTKELLNLNSLTSSITKKIVYVITHLHLLTYLFLRFFLIDIFDRPLRLADFTLVSLFFLVAYLFVIHFFYILNYKNKMEKQMKNILNDIGYGLMVLFYISYLVHHICYLREINFFLNSPFSLDTVYLIYLILATGSYDSGAYFIGKFFGKYNKLGLVVSPKKSWAGVFGGLVISCIMILIMHKIFIALNFSLYQQTFLYKVGIVGIMILTLFLAVVGQFGDFSASLHKRVLGAKDSSKLLVGHGGIYDRADSSIWVIWIGFYILYFYHLRYT